MRQPGDVLGRYVLLNRLASGGMGDVYLASKAGPLGLGPLVALKLLRDEFQADPKFIEMLADEAKISMYLDHQNIVSVLDFDEDRGAHYLVMEFVQSSTAQALVDAAHDRGTRPDPSVAIFVTLEVARALRYAHDRKDHEGRPLNIVHRDVTPANMLLSAGGEVKLTDFGIARARNRIHQTQAGVVKGKFGYLPPEAVRTQHMDRRADVFCAGVSLYLLLTSRHPAAGKTAFEAMEMYERREVEAPSVLAPELPAVLDSVIMRALEPDPGKRWPDASAWESALRNAVEMAPKSLRLGRASDLEGALRTLLPATFEAPVSKARMEAAWSRASSQLDPSYGSGTQPTEAPRRVDPLAGSDDLVLEPEDFPPAVMDRPTDAGPRQRPAQTSLDHEPMLPDDSGGAEAELDDRTLADGPFLEDDQTWLGSLAPEEESNEGLDDRTFAGLRMPEDRDTQPSDASIHIPAPTQSEVEPARSAPTLEPSGPVGPVLVTPRAPAPYFEEEHPPAPEPRGSSRPGPFQRLPSRPIREKSRGRAPRPGSEPAPVPAPPPLPSVPEPPASVLARRPLLGRRAWLLVGAISLLVGLGVVFGLTSPLLWPRVELVSRPPGAVVSVDGQNRGRTPTTVRVRPGQGPRVEFRLRDHRPEARALVGTVRRGRVYRMSVDLRPVPVLHVQPEATVSIGGKVVGTGTRIALEALPEGEVEVRVEAPGFLPYQRRFGSAAELPSTWDVTLSKR
ncbi:MAG: serine/threonine-protein kinase [Myxococcota bacterium]